MKVRAKVTVQRVAHYANAMTGASTHVTLSGKGEEVIRVHWELPGYVPIVEGHEYEVDIIRKTY